MVAYVFGEWLQPLFVERLELYLHGTGEREVRRSAGV